MDTITLKVRRFGGSLGLILPLQVTQLLDAHEGEELILTRSAVGGVCLTPYDPEFAEQIKAARSVMARYKNTIKELAK